VNRARSDESDSEESKSRAEKAMLDEAGLAR
jgi:hypothetical protein